MEHSKHYYWRTILLIPCGIAVNLVLAKLMLYFELPLFLDSIGTIAVAALCGYLPGIIVGFFSNYINSISDPITLYYSIISILLAVSAAFLSKRGWFRHLGTTLLSALIFAVIGGGLGSLLTWAIYGLNFGTGISAPYAMLLYDALGLPKFLAQLFADFLIDIIDKLVTTFVVFALLRLLPWRFVSRLPLGPLYEKDLPEDMGKCAQLRLKKLREKRTYRKISLQGKIALLIIATSFILGTLAVSISFTIYEGQMNKRYEELGNYAVGIVSDMVQPDDIDDFLLGEKSREYEATESMLYTIKSNMTDVEYIYVYKITQDGCHVVFDLDTEEVEASAMGDIIPFEEDFVKYIPALLAGEEIPTVVSNGAYGWLLTVYKPLVGTDGATKAYAAVDVTMENVVADRYVFIIRMVALLFGTTIIIVSLAILFARRRFVIPLNALSSATEKLAYDSLEERNQNAHSLESLSIKTGDEIENLYGAISKTTADVSSYLEIIDAKSAEVTEKARLISKLQDNIIISFANMVENRDENTGCHIKRTAAYVNLLGKKLASTPAFAGKMTPAYLENLRRSAPLHDIGKIKIPDSILNKPGRLTHEEFEVIKTHTTAGKEILLEVLTGIEGDNYLSMAIDMAACHHEKWDGSGYPYGLRGESIPLCARIMALADVLDALISKRCYKNAMPFDEAVDIIKADSGSHFDPAVVAAFLGALDEFRDLSHEEVYADEKAAVLN